MTRVDLDVGDVLTLLLVLARCSGIFVFTPFFGNLNIPAQVRVVLSFALTTLFALSVKLPPADTAWTLTSIFLGIGMELLVGFVIGFAAHTLFAGLQFAGQLIGFQIGLSLVNMIDPQSSTRSTSLSVYQNYLGMMIFLGLNGHHWIIRAVQKSFVVLPPLSMSINTSLIEKLTALTAQLFVIGFQVAAPVTAALFLTDFILGLIGRSAPQLQILIIGFPIKVLVGISALGLALYFFPAAMRGYSARLHSDLDVLVESLAR